MFVFVTPIEQEKSSRLREFLQRDEHAAFFQNLGVDEYHQWIQKIGARDFLMHLLKGSEVKGLSYEELLPKLESLFDKEVLD